MSVVSHFAQIAADGSRNGSLVFLEGSIPRGDGMNTMRRSLNTGTQRRNDKVWSNHLYSNALLTLRPIMIPVPPPLVATRQLFPTATRSTTAPVNSTFRSRTRLELNFSTSLSTFQCVSWSSSPTSNYSTGSRHTMVSVEVTI